MLKKVAIPAGIILTGVITISALVIAKPKPTPQEQDNTPKYAKVAVTEAKPQTIRLAVNTQGTVMPTRQIDIVAEVSGKIISVSQQFMDGAFVDANTTLLTIEPQTYQAALYSAQAQLAEAEKRLAEEQGLSQQAQREWRDLGNQAANDLFIRKPQLAAAQANVVAAKAAVITAQLNIERTQVHVPFHGRIKKTHANIGQYVTVGTPLATVYDANAVEVRLPLTEQQAALIDLPLSPQANHYPNAIINGTVAGQTSQWHGQLTRTDAFVDANSRFYYAVVEVKDPFNALGENLRTNTAPLLPGLFVEAEIEGKDIHNVLVLPRKALFKRNMIFTVDDNNAVLSHNIHVLHKTNTHVWLQDTNASITSNALITLEKQSLTPVGTTIEPIHTSINNTTNNTTKDEDTKKAFTAISTHTEG